MDVSVLDADAELLPTLSTHRPDAVFIALHGGTGEDGAIRAVLDCVGVPYVGTQPHACRVAFDKPTAKELVRRAGLSTPDWIAVGHATFRELGAGRVLDAIVNRLGMPLMVKPASGGSALGVSAVRAAAELPAAMVTAFAYADTAMVEAYVDGTEVAISAVQPNGGSATALPAVEIEVAGPYDYAARYTVGAAEFYAPARLDPEAARAASELATRAHALLALRDISRTDAIVDSRGTVHFLEVNVAPGMTETSLLPMAAGAAGLDLGALYRDLLALAVSRGC